ncbi:MAG TPA: hypothetical protein DGM69_05545 [Chloroflexi bacterium]|nr:hypothetical protein [Chloroflexota bacterium]|tara:strand:+ start:5298 stop:5924 length:627 start_codon:yes stop_codon:yes gene_type:complete
MPFSPSVTALEGHPNISMEPITTHEADGRSNTKIVFSIHTSTHIDSPQHFYADGTTIDQMDLKIFYGKTFMCDLRNIVKPGQAIDKKDLIAGGLPPIENLRGNRLLLYADWASSRWTEPNLYKGNMYLSEKTAQWLVDTGIVALAMDFSVDGHYPYPCHQIILNAGIPLIENLINLDQIKTSEFTMIALPLKIENGDGAPARVLAITE